MTDEYGFPTDAEFLNWNEANEYANEQADEDGSEPTEPAPVAEPLTDWERMISEYGITDEPALWVLEGSADDAPAPDEGPAPEPVSVTLCVPSTRTLVSVLDAAGLTVTFRRFPGSDQVSYITAIRPGLYLNLRAPNPDEIPAPAAAPARSLDDPDRLDAEAYRYLRDQISATMTGPDVWDTDDSESYILAEYVKWLADGRPVDADGYPARPSEAVPHQPNTRAALRLTAEAIEAAGEQLDNPSSFGPSARTILSQVHNTLLEIRAALTGPAGAEAAPQPEPVRVGYPVRVLPADPDSSTHSGRGRYQGSTGIVMRRGSDGWAGEGQPGTERFGVRLDYSASSPDGGQIVYFRATDLVVIGEVSQNNADPYPCANCGGRGRSQLAPLDPCIRCGGTGSDPYVNRGLSDRAMRALTEAGPAGSAGLIDREKSHILPADLADETAAVIHDLDGSGTGTHAADCSGCALEPAGAEPVPGEIYSHRQGGYLIVVRGVDTAHGIARTSGTGGVEPVGRVRFESLAADFERVGKLADPSRPYTLNDAARLGGVERLTGGAITGPYFSAADDDEADDA